MMNRDARGIRFGRASKVKRRTILSWTAGLVLATAWTGVVAAGAAPPWQKVLEKNGSVVLRVPVQGPDAPVLEGSREGKGRLDWDLQWSGPDAVLQDIDFVDPMNGFAAGELGLVLRTTDGGEHWLPSMALATTCYWYGLAAISARNVVVSGFRLQTEEGILCWSHDGGLTWDEPIVVSPHAWLERVRFRDPDHGAATTVQGGGVLVTARGGQTAGAWTSATADPSGGWSAGGFAFLPSGEILVAGSRFCRSTDGGASWQALPAADAGGDAATIFLDPLIGFAGGGVISPTTQGWIHRTTDGGNTWSPRLLAAPYPIRVLRFGGAQRGWAAGGDIYSAAGGIWGTSDGGSTWTLEADTQAEMRGLALARVSRDSVDVWSCGYTGANEGRIYRRRVYLPESPASEDGSPTPMSEVRSFPNPFSPATTLSLFMARPESVFVEIFDPSGRIIRRLHPGLLGSGTHQIRWDGRSESGERLPSGVFFYRLHAGHESRGGTLVLVR